MSQYLFIDGAYLDQLLDGVGKIFFNGETPKLDYRRVTNGYSKIFYYDCAPERRSSESQQDFEARMASKNSFFDSLRIIPGMHVFEGVVKREGRRRQQKQVDILIAVHMLTHAYRANMDRAALLAGDLDFQPVVDALVDHGIHVCLWYGRQSAATDLIHSADQRQELGLDTIGLWCIDSYRQSHEFPQISNGQNKDITGYQLLKREASPQGCEVEIYAHGNEAKFRAIYYIDVNSAWRHATHSNQEFLMRYLEYEGVVRLEK